jgi:hypothetical protein
VEMDSLKDSKRNNSNEKNGLLSRILECKRAIKILSGI